VFGKNDFAEVLSKKVYLDTGVKIIMLDHQNNYNNRSSSLLEC